MTLQKGDPVEDFELLGHDGTSVVLSNFKNSKNVVLCFYPKNHLFACPSKKVFEMAKSVISVYPKIVSTDTVLFAISVDSVESQAKFVKEYEIPYVHLSDPKKIASKKYAGTKRFGLDGSESVVPAIEQILKRGSQLGMKEALSQISLLLEMCRRQSCPYSRHAGHQHKQNRPYRSRRILFSSGPMCTYLLDVCNPLSTYLLGNLWLGF